MIVNLGLQSSETPVGVVTSAELLSNGNMSILKSSIYKENYFKTSNHQSHRVAERKCC